MPKLIKLYIVSCLLGFVISAAFTVLLLWFDIGKIGSLVAKDPMGWLAVVMIWIFNGSVFGAVQFAWKIMQMRDDSAPQDPHGGTRIKAFASAQDNATIRAEEDARHLEHHKLTPAI